MKAMETRLMTVLTLVSICGGVAFCEPEHLVYPVPGHDDWRQDLRGRTYELNQRDVKPIVWGVCGRFAGIDPQEQRSHHRYGMEIKFVFQDGSTNWFKPSKTFAATHAGWQRLSGIYQPPKPVRKADFYCRLAVKGEAWYDGVSLFETMPEPRREPCRIQERDGAVTLENEFVRVVVLPRQGATVTHLVDKRTGTDYASEDPNRRLLLDQFRQGGKCYNRPWKAETKVATDEKASVELRTSGPDGYPYLDVVRTMTLERDSAALDVAYAWYNQPASMGDLVLEPWVINGLSPRGGRNQRVMMPTAGGVRSAGPGGGTVKHRDAIGGWYAAGADDRRTMALTFDWANYAETWHYLAGDDSLVSDIILQPVKIAAGGTFETGYSFFPLVGVKSPDWIENGLAAAFRQTAGGVTLELDGARRGVFNVEVAGSYAAGASRFWRSTAFVSPDATTALGGVLPPEGLRRAVVRLYSDGALVFEADRAFEEGAVYKPKKQKAKPAEVKPFSLELKRDLVTPHAKFAHPWAGGKPRVLFLTSIHQAREIVELQQRADIEARTVRLAFDENTTNWAMIERYMAYGYADMNISLKKELETRFDAIVVSGNLLDPVDKENRAAIERQLASGTGIVRIGTKNPACAPDDKAVAWIERNVAPELLVGCGGKVRATDAGSHREVMLDYDGGLGLTPFVGYLFNGKPPFRYQDYSLGLVARAIYWAARRDVEVPADAVRSEERIDVKPGFAIVHSFWKGPKGVCDWSAKAVHTKKTAEIVSLATDREEFRIGDEVVGSVRTKGGRARVELLDGFGRLLSTTASDDGRFSLPIPEARTGLLTVKASVMADGSLADEKTHDVFCRIPYHRQEFPLCISEGWVTYSKEKEYLLPYRAKVYRDLGINFIRFWDSRRTESYAHMLRYGFDFDFSVYDARLAVHSDLFNRKFLNPYSQTHDKKYLVREPCLHDPAYRAKLDAQTRSNVRRIAKFSPVTCDCGDENTLTRWNTPFDFCFSEQTLKAFRNWLENAYGTLENLNAAWKTSYATWDAVVPDTTVEARERARKTGVKSYAAWADHRRFMELSFCETIERVAKIVDEELPGVPLDMSGCMAPNGWTGMDMWLVGKVVKEPAAYEGGLMGNYIRSFGRPFVKPWTGYGVQPKALELWPWQVGFQFLDFGLYFWTCFNFLLPDYSPTPSAIQYGKVGDEMKSGAARLLRSLESPPEVLIHYSYGSIHASRIEERGDAFDKCSRRWAEELSVRGIPYRFVAYEEIETGELDRTAARTLILPQSAAISDREASAIRRFAARGGVVVGDSFTGMMDEHCRLRDKPVLTDIVRNGLDLGEKPMDSISVFRLRPRYGAEGLYWGLVRSQDSDEGVATRVITLKEPAFVYDLRGKRALGRVTSFQVPLAAGQAKFFAALPYEVGRLSVEARGAVRGGDVSVSVRVQVPTGAKACHPVKVDIFEPDGRRNRLYSGVCDARGGIGTLAFRTALNDVPGTWRLVATDYITGKTASAALNVE